MKTMDKILVLIGIFLFLFTVTMMAIFCICGSVPDTLITCVFAALGGECGVMGWIKTAKEKYAEKKNANESRINDPQSE